jgi:hypothetical protein
MTLIWSPAYSMPMGKIGRKAHIITGVNITSGEILKFKAACNLKSTFFVINENSNVYMVNPCQPPSCDFVGETPYFNLHFAGTWSSQQALDQMWKVANKMIDCEINDNESAFICWLVVVWAHSNQMFKLILQKGVCFDTWDLTTICARIMDRFLNNSNNHFFRSFSRLLSDETTSMPNIVFNRENISAIAEKIAQNKLTKEFLCFPAQRALSFY